MPTRAQSIVVCSCTEKWGNAARARLHEDLAEGERMLLEIKVPELIRHHDLGHTLSLGENAPREFFAVIAEAARRVKAKRDQDAKTDETLATAERELLLLQDRGASDE